MKNCEEVWIDGIICYGMLNSANIQTQYNFNEYHLDITHMNTAERIFVEVSKLPDFQAEEVLDFISFLNSKRHNLSKDKLKDISVFDQFGAVYDGKFNREECYSPRL